MVRRESTSTSVLFSHPLLLQIFILCKQPFSEFEIFLRWETISIYGNWGTSSLLWTFIGSLNKHSCFSLICHHKQCVKSVRIRNYSGQYSVKMHENTDQNNSKYGRFLRSGSSACFPVYWLLVLPGKKYEMCFVIL